MPLSEKHKKHLKGLAHHLNPVVMVGQHGLSAAVLQELEIALVAHELVKVKVAGAERDERAEMARQMVAATGAELVQTIGHMAVLFRRNPERPRIQLPSSRG